MTKKLSVSLRGQQSDDLKVIAKNVGAAGLDKVIANLSKISDSPPSHAQIKRAIGDAVGSENEDVVFRHAMALGDLLEEKPVPPDDVFAALRASLPKESWSDAELAQWDSTVPVFSRLLKTDMIRSAVKTARLAVDYSHIFKSATVLTDIRPVLNTDRTSVDAGIIRHSLKLEYYEKGKETRFTLALDSADLDILIERCKRALEKEKVLKGMLEDRCKIKAIVDGDE